MRRLLLAAVLASLAGPAPAAAPRPAQEVLVDHDGGVDDMAALSLVLKSPRFRVRAVAVTPGDCYLAPATRATQLVLAALGARDVAIGEGHDEGRNPFPADWRRDAGLMLDLPAWRGLQPHPSNRVAKADAPHLLASTLARGGPYVILETGPLSNVAAALRLDPSIKRHISRIYIMGGAVRAPGNVQQPGRDGTAEWNLYNAPGAAAEVFASGVPITLVPLDATNKAPLDRRLAERLAAQPSIASRINGQALRLALRWMGVGGGYYFWDSLTAAALIDPRVVRTETLRLKVVADGPSQGRTVESPDGAPVQVAVDADTPRLHRLFLQVLGR
jgi:purine nucleosidase